MALARVRARSLGTTSPSSTVRMGRIWSRLPRRALARPMRPPFWRYSRVSRTKSRRVLPGRMRTSCSACSCVAPPAMASAARMAVIPCEVAMVPVSTTSMRKSGRSERSIPAADSAERTVPLSFPVAWMETIEPARSATAR